MRREDAGTGQPLANVLAMQVIPEVRSDAIVVQGESSESRTDGGRRDRS